MKTEWDYTGLAEAYDRRPGYAPAAIDRLVATAGLKAGDAVCDIGAGTGHLALALAARGLTVTAVEPNDSMHARGATRGRGVAGLTWVEGVAEATGQPDGAFRLAAFGSSFNVVDRPRALIESARILAPGGWFACLWNHRALDDPVRAGIEALIRDSVPGYDDGARRQDQTAVIAASDRFGAVIHTDDSFRETMTVEDCIEAWRSHATLSRQAGDAFAAVIERIARHLEATATDGRIEVPYVTRLWMAEKLERAR